jgi:hypothetical protein
MPAVLVVLLALLGAGLAGCSGGTARLERTDAATSTSADPTAPSTPTVSPDASAPSGASDDPAAYAVPKPGHLRGRLLTPDVLVTSSHTIPDSVRSRIEAVKGVDATLPISLASLSANGRTLAIAAGDPAQLRRWTQFATATSDEVWDRVAGGEVAVEADLPKRLEQPHGFLRLGTAKDAPSVHIGAYAPLIKQVTAIVNDKRADQLGMPRGNALLVSTGELTPSAVMDELRRAAGHDATLQTLALEFNVDVPQTAVLSTSSVTDVVGTFSYTPHADGRVTPDPAWVQRYIRTEQVPILGAVTCNKGMLPQLRGALTEVVQRGLADKIHRNMYGGCYYPRYIAYDPAKGLSLHTWGIAIDLNVAENQRGTVGQMDRQVVQIFKSWGFAWGGDWSYTDPMHFEMAQVVRRTG